MRFADSREKRQDSRADRPRPTVIAFVPHRHWWIWQVGLGPDLIFSKSFYVMRHIPVVFFARSRWRHITLAYPASLPMATGFFFSLQEASHQFDVCSFNADVNIWHVRFENALFNFAWFSLMQIKCLHFCRSVKMVSAASKSNCSVMSQLSGKCTPNLYQSCQPRLCLG